MCSLCSVFGKVVKITVPNSNENVESTFTRFSFTFGLMSKADKVGCITSQEELVEGVDMFLEG